MVDDRSMRFRQQAMPSIGGGPPRQNSSLDSFVKSYLRTAPVVAQTAAANNIFNPFSSVAQAGVEGRKPTAAEAGMDAGFLAAGFLPIGKAVSRLSSIVRKLNKSDDVQKIPLADTRNWVAEDMHPLYSMTREDLDYLNRRSGPYDWDALEKSITKEGIKEPLEVFVDELGEKILSSGHHRYLIAKKLGLDEIPVKFIYE